MVVGGVLIQSLSFCPVFPAPSELFPEPSRAPARDQAARPLLPTLSWTWILTVVPLSSLTAPSGSTHPDLSLNLHLMPFSWEH